MQSRRWGRGRTKVEHATTAEDVALLSVSSTVHSSSRNWPSFKDVDVGGRNLGVVQEVRRRGEVGDTASDEVGVRGERVARHVELLVGGVVGGRSKRELR